MGPSQISTRQVAHLEGREPRNIFARDLQQGFVVRENLLDFLYVDRH